MRLMVQSSARSEARIESMIYDCFRAVLRDLNEAGRQQYGDQWEPKVEEALLSLEKSYEELREPSRNLIDYSSLPFLAAYAFVYAVGRAQFMYEILRRFRNEAGAP